MAAFDAGGEELTGNALDLRATQAAGNQMHGIVQVGVNDRYSYWSILDSDTEQPSDTSNR